MRKRGGSRKWVHASRVLSVLLELAKEPLTPEQVRERTGMTKCHYVNVILRKLKSLGIVKCLNEEDEIGRVFCVDDKARRRVQRIFREKGVVQKVVRVPELNWKAYGRLSCTYCRQITIVLGKMHELASEDKLITMPGLRERLPGMATSDIYRALKKLISLGLVARTKGKLIQFKLTAEGRDILAFQESLHNQTLPNSFMKDRVATPEWNRQRTGLLKAAIR